MKKALLLITFIVLGFNHGHSQEIRALDVSPLDLAIFRPNGQGTQPVARIIYSRPQKNKREIFGGIVPFNKIWRTGANQSTEINLYNDVVFQGKTLKAGDYTMYTIPGKSEWTIIFNSSLFTWGAFDYDASKNVLEFKVPSKHSEIVIEVFGIAFEGKDGMGTLLLAWDKTEVHIDFTY